MDDTGKQLGGVHSEGLSLYAKSAGLLSNSILTVGFQDG